VTTVRGGGYLDPEYNVGVSRADWREHVGQDLAKGNGSSVYAIAGGRILGVYGSGKDTALAVDHGSYTCVYGHITPSVTTPGTSVRAGQKIGTILDYGTAGTSGDHLHLGTLERVGSTASSVLNSGWGRRPYGTSRSSVEAEGWRDPLPFLAGFGGGSGDDAGDTIDTAKRIPINATVPMTMTGADVDVVSFDLPSSGRVTASSSGSLDLLGDLLDSRGRSIATDDDSGPSTNFSIARTLNAGRYYLRISGYRDRQEGAYGVGISFDGSGGGGDDAGDTIATAKTIPINATVALTMTAGDIDILAFDIPSSGSLTAASSGSLDLLGSLVDARGSEIASDDDSGPSTNFSVSRSVSAGRYYLKVSGYRDTQAGNYGVGVTFQGATSGSTSIVMLNGSNKVPSGSLLRLPALKVGQEFPLRIVLANEGGDTARISRITLSNRDLVPNGSAPTSIRSGGTATINLKVVPSGAGTKTWSVVVAFSDDTTFRVGFRSEVNN
jgi:hypothetical protein